MASQIKIVLRKNFILLGGIGMSKELVVKALRNPELRNTVDFEHPVSQVDAEELKNISGGSDIEPQTAWVCRTVIITLRNCPSIKKCYPGD